MKRSPAIPPIRGATRRLLTLALLTAAIAVPVAGSQATAATSSRSGKNVDVSIEDFFFNPTPITVHVRDTVTWTNDGANYHSATARNGSFDTDTFAPEVLMMPRPGWFAGWQIDAWRAAGGTLRR